MGNREILNKFALNVNVYEYCRFNFLRKACIAFLLTLYSVEKDKNFNISFWC
jgi:hypothetical protein